ncbi:hypothetical protein LTR08_001408 [Meristemomyces frigidus]|nr:hypothetical protein LTR08_001408 [Meristemomyces frigidus]
MAAQVFATEELFDQIMLDRCISVRQLFAFQRVSRLFKDMIASSFYLQGRMCLRDFTQPEQKQQTLQGRADTKNANEQLSIQQFTIKCDFTSCAETDGARKKRVATLQSSGNTGLLEFTRNTGINMRLQGRERERAYGVEQTWRHVKFTRLLHPLRVEVAIVVVSPKPGYGINYVEVTELNAEHRTAAKVDAVLQGVASRSHEEHLIRAHEAANEGRVYPNVRSNRCPSCFCSDDGDTDFEM